MHRLIAAALVASFASPALAQIDQPYGDYRPQRIWQTEQFNNGAMGRDQINIYSSPFKPPSRCYSSGIKWQQGTYQCFD